MGLRGQGSEDEESNFVSRERGTEHPSTTEQGRRGRARTAKTWWGETTRSDSGVVGIETYGKSST